jgi:Plasmid pRiA4b ORF-3-like protein
VPGDRSLARLADAVLEAFDFTDTDHLYEFTYRDSQGKPQTASHDYCDGGPYADSISVKETQMPVKSLMEFKLDFGANWQFQLRLERIDPPNGEDEITLIKTTGTPPKQYPEWNED